MFDELYRWFMDLGTVNKGFVFYFFILFLLWLWNVILFPGETESSKYELTVNKKAFIREVIRWGLNNLEYENVNVKKRSVNLEVSYYQHKRFGGIFFSTQKKIKIFVNNHDNVEQLASCCLHEILHLLQFLSNPNQFENKYQAYSDKFGYENNPMEKEANEISSQNLKKCLNDLVESGYLKKV